MFNRLSLLFVIGIIALAGLVFCSTSAMAEKTVKVMVLPFEIHAQENLGYLSEEIQKGIQQNLKAYGARIIQLDGESSPKTFSLPGKLSKIRELGISHNADYIIWGSMTRIGPKFSLDLRMIASAGDKEPVIIYEQGDGLEKLLGMIRKVSRSLDLKLFDRKIIVDLRITGNKRIEADAIKRVIKTAPSDIFNPLLLAKDLKAVYAMGYFEDIRIEAENTPDGKVVTFKIEEKPTIRKITLKGNKKFDDKEVKENLTISTGSILNIFKINSNIENIESLYKEKNYHNVKVDYKIIPLDNNQADLKFIIEEGKRIKIKKINFDGNSAYTDKKLLKEIKTSEKGFFSWLTNSGDLNQENLNQDMAKLAAHYHNNGYIDARIGEPKVEFIEKWIYITVKIEEGKRYRVGTVGMSGDLILPEKELLENLKIGSKEFYSREVIRNDVMFIDDLYSDNGYAYNEIIPSTAKDDVKLIVNIKYQITKGRKVYFERIDINGNSKTRDKVIRRELKVYEQELFSGKRLKRSIRNLYRLDFFEDIKVDTSKGSADDQMVLKIDVTEKPTGILSFGVGYSSVEQMYGTGSIAQRNLFGRGQILQLKGQVGENSQRYTLSFTEPWMFDIPLSAGFDLYNSIRDYSTYDKDSRGGRLKFSYRIFDYTRAYITYGYDVSDIKNIENDASDSVKDLQGINITSSITTSLRYDSRDKIFNPTEGAEHRLSVQYAGLGGNIAFTKYIAETGYYIPLIEDTVGFIHAKTGFVQEHSQGELPDYERFYLGGINSIRGFRWRDISPVEINDDGSESQVGGDKYVQFNIEYLIPLVKEAGVVFVLFFDTGNVYNTDEPIDLNDMRQGGGYGIRWYSPVGPIRLENGYILDPEDGESQKGRWEFTMGLGF